MAIPDLIFRPFRGQADYAPMAAVLSASEQADGHDRQVSETEIKTAFEQYLTHCDPYQDLVLAEVAGQVVGYARCWWEQETEDLILYKHNGFLLPAWRGLGIGTAMLHWVEARLMAIASQHPLSSQKFFQVSASRAQVGLESLLEKTAYQPARYFYEMVRPDLKNLPEVDLPAGLVVRQVIPEHYPAIWDCVIETSRDEWGFSEPNEADYQDWLASPNFQPDLWQVAWDLGTSRVAGTVLTYILPEENAQFQRLRGYTEGIGVIRKWRRQGLATALIGLSLRVQAAAGMTESALVADMESPGLTALYEGCGFRVVNRDTVYRKAIDPR